MVTETLEQNKAGIQFDAWLRDQMKDSAPCEWRTSQEPDGCQAEAEWRLRMPCCGFPMNFCSVHKLKWITLASTFNNPYCTECGAKPVDVTAVIWTQI